MKPSLLSFLSQRSRSLPRRRSITVGLVAAVLIAACSKGGTPPAAPTNVKAEAGDGRVVLTWDGELGPDYWVYRSSDPLIELDNWTRLADSRAIRSVSSPASVPGLTNGTTYYFIVNGRNGGGKGGDASTVISAMPRAAGANWTVAPALGAGGLHAVAGTIDRLVIGGAGGTIYYSADGSNFNPVTTGITQDINGLAVNSATNVFAAVANAGVVARSANGLAFEPVNQVTNETLNDVFNNGNVFAAVGNNGAIIASSDGVIWSVRPTTNATTQNLYGVGFGNGLFVAVGATGTILTSPDSGTWSAAASPIVNDWRGVAFGNSLFVAVGAGGRIITSPDAVTWSSVVAPTALDLLSVSFGSSRFVATGRGGVILNSDDGLNWTVVSSGTTQDLVRVGFARYQYTALGAAGLNLVAR